LIGERLEKEERVKMSQHLPKAEKVEVIKKEGG